MTISVSRAVRRAAVSCVLAVACVSGSQASAGATSSSAASPRAAVTEAASLGGATRAHYPTEPVRLEGLLLAYPPAGRGTMTVVYLHGAHGKAANGCPWFRGGASELGWLVCPAAIRSEDSGTASWGSDVPEQSAAVARALRAAEAEGAGGAPGVAIGFSQGAYVALDLVKTRLGHFHGLVLIAAPEAHPSAERLKAAGVERVALAAGREDAAHDALVHDAERLAGEGMDVRFFDLGAVGHTYAAEDPAVLRDAIAWAGGL